MSWKYFNRSKISKERMYQVIRAPLITEKTTFASSDNRVGFKVASDATKHEIKLAVETLFSVKVKSVNTLNLKGKVKRFRGVLGQRSGYKKASVRLEDGYSIDVSAGF